MGSVKAPQGHCRVQQPGMDGAVGRAWSWESDANAGMGNCSIGVVVQYLVVQDLLCTDGMGYLPDFGD